jgi:aspartate aminotransferase
MPIRTFESILSDPARLPIAKAVYALGTETAFDVMAKAKAMEASGIDMIYLQIGEPDFKTPEYIIDAAKNALDDGFTHYNPTAGLPEVRKSFADYLNKTRGMDYTLDEIVITPGAKPLIFFGLLATINPGDEVIFPDPGYPIYESVIKYLKAIPVRLPLRESKGFRFDFADLNAIVTDKTKMIILNSPHNPTGGVLELEDLKRIADVAIRDNLWVMTDEIYSRILYDGRKHLSIASLPGMKERTILIDGHSKTYAMTGWRLGYAGCNTDIMQIISRLITNCNSCTASFIQIAGKAALEGPQDVPESFVEKFKERREIIVKRLNEIPGVTCQSPGGAFYVFPNFTSFGMKSREMENYLIEEAHVACLGGTSFGRYGQGYIRFSYANSVENIHKAMDRVAEVLKKLKPKEPKSSHEGFRTAISD